MQVKNQKEICEPRKISSSSFVSTIRVNVDNSNLSDVDFRQFIRNTIPIVEE